MSDLELLMLELSEERPLPVGMTEFEEWSDRIIKNTDLPAEPEGMKFALATMLMHLGPTEWKKSDAFFIASLRVAAVKQIAHAKFTMINAQKKAREETPIAPI